MSIGRASNQYEGTYKKVLCVCSAGMLRSPSAAWLLSQEPYNYNTRSAGTENYALIRVGSLLVTWADEIICMEPHHELVVKNYINEGGILVGKKKVYCLNIPDEFSYRDEELISLIREKYNIWSKL